MVKMNNQLKIVGYNQRKKSIDKNIFIFIYSFPLFLLFLLMLICLLAFFNVNIFFYIMFSVISFMLYVIGLLIEINSHKNFLYVYFKDEKDKQKFSDSNYFLKETINFIKENDIKPIINDNYFYIYFDVDEDYIDLYNELKYQYEIVNF